VAARAAILIVGLAAAGALALATLREAGDPAPRAGAPASRIVSVVPALTEILVAIGAGPQLAGISSYDDPPPGRPDIPRVGALLNPDTERILSLRPDMVIVYGSQTDLESRLQRAGIATYPYRHAGIADVLATIRDLADRTGHPAEGARLAAAMEAQFEAVARRVRGRPTPRTLLVLEREPDSLRGLYASGGRGFLHEMLAVAGGENIFADVDRESVQPSIETILARAPDVILEVRAIDQGVSGPAAWDALPAVPAVRAGRVHVLTGPHFVVPGSRLGDATEALARALHSDAFR
jgi:iron complex transport system substrate-binding protein